VSHPGAASLLARTRRSEYPSRTEQRTDSTVMRNWFTFENLPLTLIIALIIWSWLSFFSVILFAD
jgi:hypothetical protein